MAKTNKKSKKRIVKNSSELGSLREAMEKGFGGVNKQFDGVNKQFERVDKQLKKIDQQFDGWCE
ncbi:MAG: hypothetical protein HYT12_02475 [Candidatus Liptonbacteria bacterium]|nr:hypothetical protein [Candidatus Liptonbacteria bacterium]